MIQEKLPEAIVVGGYPNDRAEVVSRMLGCGWRVREHRLAGQTGDDYQRLPTGVKLVVVLRDTLDEKQYNRAHTMADIGKVPVVKWDIDRHRFRGRLERLGLLFEDLARALASPKPPEPEKYVAEPINGVPVLAEVPQIVVKDFLQPLLALAEMAQDELTSNPHYKGLTIRAMDDGSFEVTPEPRTFKLPARGGVRTELKPTFIGPGLVGSHDPSDRTIRDPTLEERPVVQPIQPVYKPIEPKIEPKPKVDALGRKIGKRSSMDMRCRYPNCNAQSRGPRYQFHCAAHSDIPMRDKKINMAAYKKEQHAPH